MELLNQSIMNSRASHGDVILENMSEGIIELDEIGVITYVNDACLQIFSNMKREDLIGKTFEEAFLRNRKNRILKIFYRSLTSKDAETSCTLTYRTDSGKKIPIEIQLVSSEFSTDVDQSISYDYQIFLIKDLSIRTALRQHERDCTFIFSGLIICITTYLMAWRFFRFTLHKHLPNSTYTLMIELITFLLFLEIIFMTSFSFGDVGLLPSKKKLLKNIKEILLIGTTACLLLLALKTFLLYAGFPVKQRFIGGSITGASNYLLTAFVQEFLARGVIQTSIQSLVKGRYQKVLGILLTSLLFSLMHMPFGFIFMMSALLLSLALGYIFERHGDLWGCFLLHWVCGYLTMCLFF